MPREFDAKDSAKSTYKTDSSLSHSLLSDLVLIPHNTLVNLMFVYSIDVDSLDAIYAIANRLAELSHSCEEAPFHNHRQTHNRQHGVR